MDPVVMGLCVVAFSGFVASIIRLSFSDNPNIPYLLLA
jgi:hypothetical protein